MVLERISTKLSKILKLEEYYRSFVESISILKIASTNLFDNLPQSYFIFLFESVNKHLKYLAIR